MLEKKGEKRRKAARLIVLGAALLLGALLFAANGIRGEQNARTAEARLKYIRSLGWEVVPDCEEREEVRIPDCSKEPMQSYNELMRRGGFDLSGCEGKTVERYSYELSNYPGCADRVYLILYVHRGRVVGGDIHTAELDGFMHELRARE